MAEPQLRPWQRAIIKLFRSDFLPVRTFTWGDGVVLLLLLALLVIGLRLAKGAPVSIAGPEIELAPTALPSYLWHSLWRMAAAYCLSVVFSLVYGSLAANYRLAEKILIPLLDVLQSIPILSFLPVVLLSLTAVLPLQLAVELSAIVLIFTSQVWNLTFAWYQALTTIPHDLQEAARIFQFNGWLRFKALQLPFAAITLIWNSMMSWAGGWFFLMAAEIFTAGNRDFRLQGLGSYLQTAADAGDLTALAWGLLALIGTIVVLDQLVWRPLLAWSVRFKLSLVEEELPPRSWFYDAWRQARLLGGLRRWFSHRLMPALDAFLVRQFPFRPEAESRPKTSRWPWLLGLGLVIFLTYETYQALVLLSRVSVGQWQEIGLGLLATLLRVFCALLLALAWTLPLGVAIGVNRRLAVWLQPLAQIAASVPATALFPAIVMLVLKLPGGLNLAAILLMLLGTQWYLLFNIIAGASAIPRELLDTASLLQFNWWERWRFLFLPALFPYTITGAITAAGGAWNASIVAEYIQFGGETHVIRGIGALISQATAAGDYPLLLAATLSMILAVSLINRLFWRRLYRLAEERFRLD